MLTKGKPGGWPVVKEIAQLNVAAPTGFEPQYKHMASIKPAEWK